MALATIDQIEEAGGFPIVYADPAWKYRQGGRGSARNKYREMPLAEVRALPVSRLASPDAALFLWGTWPHLPDVLGTIPAWGFEYKTCAFVWVKHRSRVDVKHVGGGFWTRANTEFCLLATRGEIARQDSQAGRSVRQLIETEPRACEACSTSGYDYSQPDTLLRCPVCGGLGLVDADDRTLLAPLGEHSAKPAEARDRIVQLMGDLPRVELFARQRAPGWAAWGDEVEPEIDMGV